MIRIKLTTKITRGFYMRNCYWSVPRWRPCSQRLRSSCRNLCLVKFKLKVYICCSQLTLLQVSVQLLLASSAGSWSSSRVMRPRSRWWLFLITRIRLAFLFIISGGVNFTSVRRTRQCDNTTRVGKKDGIFKRPHLTKPRKLRSQFIVIVMCPFIFITTLYLHSILLYNLSHFV